MIDYKEVIKNRELRLKLIYLLRFIPTEPYLKLVYRIKMGKKLNLEHPITFSEKLQWLKIHDVHPEYTKLVDKYEVRNHIAKTIGEEHLIPLLGVWDSFDEINFDELPNQFVLKCTHDSGSVKIINKDNMDLKYLKHFFKGRLRFNGYPFSREYPYKNVTPRIIAEAYMQDSTTNDFRDYKFHCFDGKIVMLEVVLNRLSQEEEKTNDFFDSEFNHLDITEYPCPHAGITPQKPEKFELMKRIAELLSSGKPYVRIDLYEANGVVYFGEFTFFESGGYIFYQPEHWNTDLGDLLVLSNE